MKYPDKFSVTVTGHQWFSRDFRMPEMKSSCVQTALEEVYLKTDPVKSFGQLSHEIKSFAVDWGTGDDPHYAEYKIEVSVDLTK